MEGFDLCATILALALIESACVLAQQIAYIRLSDRHRACRHELGKEQRDNGILKYQLQVAKFELDEIRRLNERRAEHMR